MSNSPQQLRHVMPFLRKRELLKPPCLLNMPSMTLAAWTCSMENTPKNIADKSNFFMKVTFGKCIRSAN